MRRDRTAQFCNGIGAGSVEYLVRILRALLVASAIAVCPPLRAATNDASAKLLTRQGTVEFASGQVTNWNSAPIGQKLVINDRLRTFELSKATVQLEDFSVLRVNELSVMEILPPRQGTAKARLDFRAGALYFLHRNNPGEIEIETPNATAAIEGTEFHIAVDANNVTVLTMIDGKVELANALGTVSLNAGEQGIAQPGQPPRKTAVINTVNIIQWSLYYPGVLDPDELGLDAVAPLGPSLAAYRSGDLLAALQNYPAGRAAPSVAERIYYAGLLLSAGRATNYEALLQTVDAGHPLASALERMVAAVKLQTNSFPALATNASQLLGESYYLQSQRQLSPALRSARAASERSPNFAFAWERVAELEFGFGRVTAAETALDRALVLAPRNAQAHALKGFLLLARDDLKPALDSFETAIRLDNTLGNAWLGRGLCRIRRKQAEQGRADLQTAAALEPNRWIFRSYLGKAYANAADKAGHRALRKDLDLKAEKELNLAKAKDPNDPTPWLYSALLDYQHNKIGAAVNDLEESVELNNNRAVYRSRLLLDQDHAVRSANLANIYQSAGMPEVSLRESAAAVGYDYGNYSAHYNLASSYNALRDPTRFNLRHESDWFHELLLANLLQQGGGGSLSQHLSQQEYSRPFEENHLGLTSSTEYFGEGEVRQLASQFGTFGRTSYALDLDYNYKSGVRPNNELSRIEWYTRVKEQITEQDSLFLLTKYQDYSSGDNFQYYDPASARPNFKLTEKQEPILLAGYHREWSPGVHTLLLGGRLVNDQHYTDSAVNESLLALDSATLAVTNVFSLPMDVDYHSKFEIYSLEANQIIQREKHTDVFGARFQRGHFDTQDRLTLSPGSELFAPFFNSPPAEQSTDEPFERIAVYGYHTWEPFDRLFLTGGLSYDRVTYPNNFRISPITPGHQNRDRLSPKVSLIWNPVSALTLRGAYMRSLGGVSYDESVRLEPTQLAGFGQTFRSVISESLVGSVSAPAYNVGGVALDLKFKTRTYLGLEAQFLESDLQRSVGSFAYTNLTFPPPPIQPVSTPEQLNYNEKSFKATLNQVIANEWFFEAQYRFTRSELRDRFTAVPSTVNPFAETFVRAELQQVALSGLYIHSSGLFARAESWWFFQKNFGYLTPLPGDDFPQFRNVPQRVMDESPLVKSQPHFDSLPDRHE